MARWADANHTAMLKLAARLVAELCLAYDVPPYMRTPQGLRAGKHGLCEHDDVSDAWHQSSHWDLGNFPRRRFAVMVRREVAAIKGTTAKRAGRLSMAQATVQDKVSAATTSRRTKEKRKGVNSHDEGDKG
jgi:hypothetical protein